MSLAAGNLGLAHWFARRFPVPDPDALLGEAVLALVEAERDFDPERGKFSAFAAEVIRCRCLAEARRQRSRVREEPLMLTNEDGQEYERPDLATDPETERGVLGKQVAEMLSDLPERDRRVLVLRFGLEDGRERTLVEVGAILGISRERVHVLEARALAMVRKATRRRRTVVSSTREAFGISKKP